MKFFHNSILKIKQVEMRKLALELLLPVKEGIILEVGCSNGNFAELLNEKKVYNYVGIDILEDKIKIAKKRYPNLYFKCADICKEELIWPVSALVSFQALEHIPDDKEIFKKLDKGTKVVFSVPNSPYGKNHLRWFELEGWKNHYKDLIDFDFHLTIQNPVKLSKRSFLFRGYRK